jgi:hypothetical protein
MRVLASKTASTRHFSINRIGVGMPMIDVKGRQIQSESFHPFQKGLDVFLIAMSDFLRGDDPAMFILEH